MALLTTCQASFQSMKDYEDVKDDVESLKENIHECYSEISKTSEQIQHTVRETYLTKSELETIQKDFQASITQNSSCLLYTSGRFPKSMVFKFVDTLAVCMGRNM